MKLTGKEKFSYGIGAVGKDLVYSLVSGFLMYYYNTVLGVSATFIGIIFMVARLIDAFTDPMMGIIVDRTNSKMGRFRPWILIGTITNVVVLVAMFAVPDISGVNLLIYISIMYVLWGLTYTIIDIPFWSMIPAIAESGADRESMSVVGRSSAGVGSAIPTALTMALVPLLGSGDERKGFALFAVIIAVSFLLSELVLFFGVKERARPQTSTISVKEMFRALLKNDQAMVIVVSGIVLTAALYMTNQFAVYAFKYDLGKPEMFGLFASVSGIGYIISMMTVPLWRKLGNPIQVCIYSLWISIFGYIVFFVMNLLGITNVPVLSIGGILIFSGIGVTTVLSTVFLADSVDYGEYKTGQRNESVIFSMQTFSTKLASAVSGLFVGVGIDVIGLDAAASVQSPATILGLQILMCGLPLAGMLATLLYIIRKFKLTDGYMQYIKEEITNRHK